VGDLVAVMVRSTGSVFDNLIDLARQSIRLHPLRLSDS